MIYKRPRCQALPLPDNQVSFQVDDKERLRWHFGSRYERPFFYPFVGPSGNSLTRIGHPGASNHDHHRSVWFAHHKVLGINFWTNQSGAKIRKKQWLCLQDGDNEAVMAVLLGWYDGHDPQELLQQQVVAAMRPGHNGETFLELQSTFLPTAESLEFGKTNFGFLAVRMAKSISAYFGGGQLTDSEGRVGEKEIFAKRSRWVDYSGPNGNTTEGSDSTVEGITYFDHPANPGFPSHWHVREDGWMGASVCMNGPMETSRQKPLMLRYLLHGHRGTIESKRAESKRAESKRAESERAEEIAKKFAASKPYIVERAKVRHTENSIRRA